MKLTRADSTDPTVNELCVEQQAELAGRDLDAFNATPKKLDPRIAFVVAYVTAPSGDRAVGCAGLQPLEPGVGELKRMYVRPDHRRNGLARLLLAEIERMADERGITVLRLETGRDFHDVVALYVSSGFYEIPRFGGYVDAEASACFEKQLRLEG
ncbi:GNAT family N-acetyltransferase [Streptosporangiaceae bacterium NEAU-GS5]|nr:GNAT family N-acetyltransferase [Streptosporangiaceae bacterium NEAU-GS5]